MLEAALIFAAGFVGAALGVWIDRELRLVPKPFVAHEMERRLRHFEGEGSIYDWTSEPHVSVSAGPYDRENEEASW